MVSIAKKKKRLNAQALQYLKDKNPEVPMVDPDLEAEQKKALEEQLNLMKDELMRGIVGGIEAEIRDSSPKLRRSIEKNSAILKELVLGIKEGIDAEVKDFIDKSTSTLNMTVEEATQKIAEQLKTPTDFKEVVKLLEEQVKLSKDATTVAKQDRLLQLIQTKESFNIDQDGDDVKDLLRTLIATVDRVGMVAGKVPVTSEMVAGSPTTAKEKAKEILGRGKQFAEPEGTMASKAGNFALAVTGDLFGIDKFTEKKIEERKQRESFIETERKLRSSESKEFAQLSKRQQTEILKRDYKTIQKETTNLEKLEKNAEILASKGYSEEQIEKTLGYAQKRSETVGKITAADPSRNKTEARDLTSDEISAIDLSKFKAPAKSEEQAAEEALVAEKSFDQQQEQTELLKDIRDNLMASKPSMAEAASSETGSNLGDITGAAAGAAGGLLKKGKGALLRGAKALMSSKALKIGGGALAVGMGAYTAFKGYNEADVQGQEKMAAIDAAEKSGELTPEQAAVQRAEVSKEVTENKGGAIGKGTGIAAGSLMGMKAGAMLGSFAGPVGTLVGGAAGGLIGGIAGSSVGQNIGGAIGKGYGWLKGKISPATIDKNTKQPIVSVDQSIMSTKSPSLALAAPAPGPVETMAAEIGKKIVIQAPPPTVINGGGGGSGKQEVIPQPFTNLIKNDEPSINNYIRRRMA